MKKKIKNILKYISLAIVGAFVFMFGLSAQAYRKDDLSQYIVDDDTFEGYWINTSVEQDNQNTQQYADANTFTYRMFNLTNYKANMQLNNYMLTIPFTTIINLPQSNNYDDNEYNTHIYYYYTNTSTYDDSKWETANIIESNNGSISKNGVINATNYITDFLNLELTQDNYQYLYIGYYTSIDYINNDANKFVDIQTYINFQYTLLNVYSGTATQEQQDYLNARITSLQNELNNTNNENTNLYNEIETISNQLADKTNDYNNLQNNYSNLQELYNGLATQEYTFENLFWSVGSVPMAFLLQSFNVNVLGLNIAAIITGLITALIIIWLIKRLIK